MYLPPSGFDIIKNLNVLSFVYGMPEAGYITTTIEIIYCVRYMK